MNIKLGICFEIYGIFDLSINFWISFLIYGILLIFLSLITLIILFKTFYRMKRNQLIKMKRMLHFRFSFLLIFVNIIQNFSFSLLSKF